MEAHRLHAELLTREVRILVVGCGGTGSAVLGGLPYLHQAMLAHGHPCGLSVTVMDGDVVSPFNCVRQPFSRSEIGLNKGIVLMSRINLFWGVIWRAVPRPLTSETLTPPYVASANWLCVRISWWVVSTRGRHARSSRKVPRAAAAWATGLTSAIAHRVVNSFWVNH